jgi:hypothetical protein
MTRNEWKGRAGMPSLGAMKDEKLEILVAAYQADAPAWRVMTECERTQAAEMNCNRSHAGILKIAAVAPERPFRPTFLSAAPFVVSSVEKARAYSLWESVTETHGREQTSASSVVLTNVRTAYEFRVHCPEP